MDATPTPMSYSQESIRTMMAAPQGVAAPDIAQQNQAGARQANLSDPYSAMKNAASSQAQIGEDTQKMEDQAADAELQAKLLAWNASGASQGTIRGTPEYFKRMVEDESFAAGLSPRAAQKFHKLYGDTVAAEAHIKDTMSKSETSSLELNSRKNSMMGEILSRPVELYKAAHEAAKGDPAKTAAADEAYKAALVAANEQLVAAGLQPLPKDKIASGEITADKLENTLGVHAAMQGHLDAEQKRRGEAAKEKAELAKAEHTAAQTSALQSKDPDVIRELISEAEQEGNAALVASLNKQLEAVIAGKSGAAAIAGIPEDQVKPEERKLAVNQWIQNPSSLRGMDKTYQRNVIKWASDLGITPEDVIGGRAQQKFQLSAATTAGHRAGTMQGVEAVIPKLIANAETASNAVPRGSFVPLNKLSQMTDAQMSDPALREFKLANMALASEYQQVISRGGTNVTALKEAMDMLQTADSQQTYSRALRMLEKEVKANKEGMEEVASGYGSDVQKKLGGSNTHSSKEKQFAAKLPDGHTYYFKDQASLEAFKKEAGL